MRRGALLLVVAGAALGQAPARAAGEDVFVVAGVAVDATAKNANAARELALAEGHAVAFRKLVARLVPQARIGDVPRLGHDKVAPMVRSFEVADEKTSSVRYLAKLTFQFDGEAVRRFLRGLGVPFAEARSKPMLVLPVFRTAGALMLWDEPNPWREAWAGLGSSGDLVPLIIPFGDLQDVRDVSAAQAVGADDRRRKAIAARYGAAGVIVALAALKTEGAGASPSMQVTLTRFAPGGEAQTTIDSIEAEPSQTVDELIDAAALRTQRLIEDEWKSRHLLRFDQQNEIVAVVPLAGLGEWVRISKGLAGMPSVEDSRVLSMSRREARIRLRFYGDEGQLAGALAQNNMQLVRQDEAWVLRLGGGSPSAAEAPGTGGE